MTTKTEFTLEDLQAHAIEVLGYTQQEVECYDMDNETVFYLSILDTYENDYGNYFSKMVFVAQYFGTDIKIELECTQFLPYGEEEIHTTSLTTLTSVDDLEDVMGSLIDELYSQLDDVA